MGLIGRGGGVAAPRAIPSIQPPIRWGAGRGGAGASAAAITGGAMTGGAMTGGGLAAGAGRGSGVSAHVARRHSG